MIKKLVLSLLILLCCKTLHAQDAQITAEEYINTYKDLAVAEMKRTGIPASITLAQGLLESGNGNSYLAKQANNHFGIKCKSGWTGRSVNVDDDELQECFRAYDKAEDSYHDHSDFLIGNSRYGFLFKLDPKDYKGWAYGLKQAGYATNPRYPQMLIDAIEKYKLNDYDAGNTTHDNNQTANKQEPKKNIFGHTVAPLPYFQYNNIPAYIVKPGDNYGTVADSHRMMRWELRVYNDLKPGENLKPGTIIYLKPKKRKAKEEFHEVKQNEGMYDISQYHGIKLRLLYKWNRMKKGEEPAVGEKLYLRYKRETPPALKAPGTVMEKRGVRVETLKGPEPKTIPDKDSTIKNPPPAHDKDSAIDLNNLKARDVDGVDSMGKFHLVQKDETLYEISKEHNTSFGDLLNWNHVSGALKEGQKIYLTRPANYVDKQKKPPVKKGGKPVKDTASTYVVQKGETLFGISKKTGVSIDSIIEINSLETDELMEGQTLILRKRNVQAKPGADDDKNNGTEPVYHTVVSGETLYSIARQYHVSVADIIKMNSLPDNTISIGQKLKVKD